VTRSVSTLDDVLVVTVRKSFWASREAEVFPHRLYARLVLGASTTFLNAFLIFARALLAIAWRRPRVVLLGSVERAVPWFIRARRLGLLGNARLVVTNQLHLDDEQLRQVDRVVVYSREWIERQRPAMYERAVFVPLPADGDLAAARLAATASGRVFAGGGAGRDFGSVIRALASTGVPLEIVTFSRETLGWDGELPANVSVELQLPVQEFLARVASSLLVVVPLSDPDSDFGQTTVVQALALGKAVVATRAPSIADYVRDGVEGVLVEAGDVAGYRDAVLRLARDDSLRRACEERARKQGAQLTYDRFRDRLVELIAALAADQRE
jgi:glycosyltransferase involved in cell wall biosynthesis